MGFRYPHANQSFHFYTTYNLYGTWADLDSRRGQGVRHPTLPPRKALVAMTSRQMLVLICVTSKVV